MHCRIELVLSKTSSLVIAFALVSSISGKCVVAERVYDFNIVGAYSVARFTTSKEEITFDDGADAYFRSKYRDGGEPGLKIQELLNEQQAVVSEYRSDPSNDGYTFFSTKDFPIDEANRLVLEDINSRIEKKNDRQRFKQLLTAFLISRYDSLAALRLNDVSLTRKQYDTLREKTKQLSRRSDIKSPHRYRLSLELLKPFLGDIDLEDAAGEEFTEVVFDEGKGLSYADPVLVIFQDVPLKMIGSPLVQKELEVSPRQVSRISALLNSYDGKISVKIARMRMISGGPGFEANMNRWRKKIDTDIQAILNDKQKRRFDQLLFQHHVLFLELPWVRKAAGKEFKYDEGMKIAVDDLRTMKAQVNYLDQIDRMQASLDMLREVIGDAKVEKIVGQLVLWRSSHDDLEKRSDLYNSMLRRLRGATDTESGPKNNPRRRSQ